MDQRMKAIFLISEKMPPHPVETRHVVSQEEKNENSSSNS